MNNQDSIKSIHADQINKFQQFLGAALLKSNLQSEPSQHVLKYQGEQVIDTMMDVVLKYTEAISNMIVFHVAVNRSLSQ